MIDIFNKSVFYAGSWFSENLKTYSKKGIPVAGSVAVYPEEGEDARQYLARFAAELRKAPGFSKAKYLVVELQCMEELLAQEAQREQMDESAMDGLAGVIESRFAPGKVIVILTHHPKYYIMDGDLIRGMPKYLENTGAAGILRRYEGYLRGKTQGVSVNTTSFYFYRKQTGYLVNSRSYEPECYEDISRKIRKYVTKGGKISTRPGFGLTLERYIKLQGKTIQWNALGVFINREHPLEQLVLSSPVPFVRDHKDQLIKAHSIRLSGNENWKKDLCEALPEDEDFCDIVIAFLDSAQGRIEDEERMKKMFRQGIVSRSLLSMIQKYAAEQDKALPVQINPHNAGYYYALMQGHEEEDAKSFAEDASVIRPVPIDIFGSCIARTCLREHYSGIESLAANKYWFQIPGYLPSQEAPEYDESVMEGRNDFYSKTVSLQLENRVLDDMSESKAGWMLIDLYGLTQPHLYSHHGFVYSDFTGKIAREMGSEKVDVLGEGLLGTQEEILSRLDPWLEAVKEKYRDQIILLEINYSYMSKGDDNVIYAPRNREKAIRRNDFFRLAFDYAREKLDCYTIEITHEFCPDDRGYQKRSTVHYSYDFYEQAGKLMDYIVQNKPEEKRFAAYDNRVRTRRLADMLEKNPPEAASLFFTRPLDSCVMRAEAGLIRENEELIASWYDRSIRDEEELRSLWESDWDPRLRHALLETGPDRSDDEEYRMPADYPTQPAQMQTRESAGQRKEEKEPPRKRRLLGLFR